jgi:hypothetical protein
VAENLIVTNVLSATVRGDTLARSSADCDFGPKPACRPNFSRGLAEGQAGGEGASRNSRGIGSGRGWHTPHQIASSIPRPRRPAAVGQAANRNAWVRAWVLQIPRPQKRQTPSAVAPQTQHRTRQAYRFARSSGGGTSTNARENASSSAPAWIGSMPISPAACPGSLWRP